MHDFENCRFYGVNGRIDLTVKENFILDLLIRNKGYIVKYSEIIEKLYNLPTDKKIMNVLSTITWRLKIKLKDDITIKTKRNVGYWIDN